MMSMSMGKYWINPINAAIGCATGMIFAGTLFTACVIDDRDDQKAQTEQMTTCVQAGGSWHPLDKQIASCEMPSGR